MNRVSLRERVILVTGASAGIGRELCLHLVAEGARVVAVGRDHSRLERLGAELRGVEPAADLCLQRADVTSARDAESMARAALERWGRIDALVACAGLLRAPGQSLETLAQMSLGDFSQVVDTNLKGVFLTNRAVLPAMLRQRSGHILNLSSTSGRAAHAFDTAYCASKFGVIGLTEAVAREVESGGVRAEVLLPGAIDTPIWDQNGPIRRPAAALPPARVAEVALYMLTRPDDVWLPAVALEPNRLPELRGWRASSSATGGGTE